MTHPNNGTGREQGLTDGARSATLHRKSWGAELRRSYKPAALALIAVTASAADRPPPPALAPSGPWVVEAEIDTCLVQRGYGPPEKRVLVAFQPVFNFRTMDVIVVSPLGGTEQRIGDAKLRPGPSGETVPARYTSVRLNNKPQRFTRITMPRAFLDALPTAQTLSIQAKPVDVTVQLTAFDKAMKAFTQCQEGLLRSWGVDPASVTPERLPKPRNVMTYFSPEAYPVEALRSGIFGRVIAVLQVDASGKVAACRITASAGTVLNAGTCRQAMKIPFDPGTDAAGKPAPSIYVLPVRWVLPG